jgi:hypothetical protein
MKKLSINPRMLFAAMLIGATFSFATPVSAAVDPVKENNPVELSLVGIINQAPVFQLNFNNEAVESYLVTIRDRQGVVYSETLKGTGKELSRKYQFVNEGVSDDEQLQVIILNNSTKKLVSFTVSQEKIRTADVRYIISK